MTKKHIAILAGGWNSEREISLTSGKAAQNSLQKLGYKTTFVDVDRNIAGELRKINPDAAFIALHGKFGEDGKIQGLLDIMDIPYTHSKTLACAIAMNKYVSKQLFSHAGILCPGGVIISKGDSDTTKLQKISQINSAPFVIKPNREGSSIGLEIYQNKNDFDILTYHWQHSNNIIAEEYIRGSEIHVGIMDGKALGAIDIAPESGIYDFESKYTKGKTAFTIPAPIPEEKYNEVLDIALQAYNILQCEGIARADFRFNNLKDGDNQFYLLELNTHPGLTEQSTTPMAAQILGISFNDIVKNLIENASCDSK